MQDAERQLARHEAALEETDRQIALLLQELELKFMVTSVEAAKTMLSQYEQQLQKNIELVEAALGRVTDD